MTRPDIERLIELAEKATPGEWKVVGKDNWNLQGFPQVETNTPEGHYFPVNTEDDADFIAASRTLAPAIAKYALELEKELAEARAREERLREAVEELLEVARLRGDNELPDPADDPKLWTARMQEAWVDLEQALEGVEA